MHISSMSTPEGRALAARPSACLILVAALLAIVFPATASAVEPNAPLLTETNPPSPSAALRPFVLGDSDGGVITSAIGGAVAARLGGPVSRTSENPTFLITVYAEDGTCSDPGSIVAEGTAAELEEPGLQVTKDVTAGVETLFFAKQTDPSDPANPSKCSNGIGYRHVDGPPGPPVFTGTDPSSPADDNFPNLIGHADVQTTIEIYDTSNCAGTPLASGSVAAFEKSGIEVHVADNSTTTFHAKAKIAEYSSTCSISGVDYQEVSAAGEEPGGENPGGEGPGGESPGGGGQGGPTAPNPPGRPPAPTLRTVPGYAANDNTPTVTGKAPGAGIVQVYGSAGCRGPVLAQGPAGQFTGPGFGVQVANDTVVTFYGISIDGGNDRSLCSEQPAVYIEDSTAPHTRITSGPAAKTRKRRAVFRFTDVAGESTTTFFCKLDRRRWKVCRAPLKLKHLGRRRHLLKVRAVDAAGNVEKRMAKRRFRVVRSH